MFRGISAALLAAGAVLALSAQAPAPNPDELVRNATEAPKHVSYVGQLQSTRWGTTRAVATIARIEHMAPDLTRRTYLAPQALYGEYVITHGAKTSEYDVKQSQVVTTQNFAPENQVALNDNIALLSANYRAIVGPRETVAGRDSDTVTMINRHTGERMMRLWIDAQTKIVLAKESYHSDGSLATRMRFDEIRYTKDIPASIFDQSVPSGYRAVAGRQYGAAGSTDVATAIKTAIKGAGFTPVGPRYLPEGFSIISADVNDVKGVKSLHLLYSDGLRNLSLFQNASNAAADFGALRPTSITFEDHEAQYVKDGPTTLLAWREHNLAFALVGDLDVKEMTDIATSVIP